MAIRTMSIYDHISGAWDASLPLGIDPREELAHWRATIEPLNALTDVDALPSLVAADPDAVLGALLDLHQAGSDLAGALLLRQMLPKLRLLTTYARTTTQLRLSDDDRRSMVITRFLTLIRTHRGRTGIAGALALLTLRGIQYSSRAHFDEQLFYFAGDGDIRSHSELTVEVTERTSVYEAHDEPAPDITGAAVLEWAHSTGIISDRDRDLIARAYLDGVTGAQIAAEVGMSPAALRQRLHRAVARIRSAVLADMTAATDAICSIAPVEVSEDSHGSLLYAA